jgi:hypothetical protein
MPVVPGPGGVHRSHRFALSRSPDALRTALAVEARRVSPTSAALTLRPVGVGHAFPTGDLFRRIEVSVEAAGPDQNRLGGAVRYLARHFVDRPLAGGGFVRVMISDDRPTGAASVMLDAGPGAAGRPLGYRVAYQRVVHPDAIDEAGAVVDGEVVLSQGVLPP